MKKIFFLSLAALGMLASCSKVIDSPEIQDQKTPATINFGTYAGRTTKADVVEIEDLITSGFYVSGIYNSTEYLKDHVKYETTNGRNRFEQEADVTKYWPADINDKPITFYANNTKAINYNAGTLSFDYTTTTQFDVVVAQSTPVTVVPTSTNATVGTDYRKGCQDLKFTHALTKVNFSLEGADKVNHLTYNVTALKLETVCGGTYTYGETTPWGELGALVNEVAYEIPASTTWTDGTVVPLNSNLMLIPQTGKYEATDDTMPATEDGGYIRCSIKYSVTDNTNVVLFNGTKKFRIPTTVNGTPWAPNKSFRYVLTLAVGADPITFAATVDNWDDEIEGGIEVK